MFGKRKSKEILLTCPYCQKQQNEPRFALSTFCRSCGEHYKIKNGEAVGSPGAGLSGIATFRELGEVEVVGDRKSKSPEPAESPVSKPKPKPEQVKEVAPEPVETEKEETIESREETSITSIKETGAETWVEVPQDDEGEAEEETPKPQVKVEDADANKDSDKGKTTAPVKADTEFDEDEDDEEDEEEFSNPIARAAAEAAAREKEIRALEEKLEKASNKEEDDEEEEIPVSKKRSRDKSGLGANAEPKESLAAGSMEAMFKGLSTNVDVGMRADKVVTEKEEKKVPEKSGPEKVEAEKPLDPKKMPSDFVPPSKKADPNSRPVRCFKCNHQQMVSRSATSSQCGRCSVYISLSDYDIKTQQSQTIRTRGNVTIHRRGSLIGCDIACHDLTVLGKISGSVDCSGNATFKNSGKVMGSMHCKHLHVDKKCELMFPQGVVAESADIHGIVNGDITCSGTIKIFRTGAVNGDATAKAIVLKDGGVLSGQMSIQHDVDIELPLKRGYDPSIIS